MINELDDLVLELFCRDAKEVCKRKNLDMDLSDLFLVTSSLVTDGRWSSDLRNRGLQVRILPQSDFGQRCFGAALSEKRSSRILKP